MTKAHIACFLPIILSLLLLSCQRSSQQENIDDIVLNEGWLLISSMNLNDKPIEIEHVNNLHNAFVTEVPSSVLATLVANGVYQEPYFSKNLENIPTGQFEVPWWYIKTFDLDRNRLCQNAILSFKGINYRADIWLNGIQIASSDTLEGAFRTFEIHVSELFREKNNVLAVQVFPPTPGKFTIGFVDWNPAPPDKNMGLFRPVEISFSNKVAIQSPFVKTNVDTETLQKAELTIETNLKNFDIKSTNTILIASVEHIEIQKQFSIPPGETVLAKLEPAEFKQLIFKNPRLWWPNGYGNPDLYQLKLEVFTDGELSDSKTITFGIREIEDYYNEQGHRGFKINGKNILIKGGGWVDDLLLADPRKKIKAQVDYARHLNLNTLRLEGFWGSHQTLYNLCDSAGIMMMVGWSCHWEWEDFVGKVCDDFGGVSTQSEMDLISKSWYDQIMMLRNHPSIFVWLGGSDKLPRPELEKRYLEILEKIDGERAYIGAAGDLESEISGPTGVKMNGPYAFTPPIYWYVDKKFGGAFGFNTETGPGAQISPISAIKKMIPEDSIWPINSIWEYHCALSYKFNNLDRLVKALELRYGKSNTADDFVNKAQIMNYELMRPMFESFRVNKGEATGIIQWMYNSAWPKMYWQLFDWNLMPNGAFYGAKKALEPLQLVYNYGNHSISAVNGSLNEYKNLISEIRVWGLDSQLKFEKTVSFNLSKNGVVNVLPEGILNPYFDSLNPNQFLQLLLYDSTENVKQNNFYWLSSKADIPDFPNTEVFYTPTRQYTDFTQVMDLPFTNIETDYRIVEFENEKQITVSINNKSDQIALFIELTLLDQTTGEPILPVFWDDNYISLVPGEKRDLRASFSANGRVKLQVKGLNVNGFEILTTI